MVTKNNTFGALFKKYRLKAEFETLSEFGDALAEEGFIYEDSIFSHWQKGDRIPKQRELIITILKIFIKKRAIKTENEANQFFVSVGQQNLNEDEKIYLFSKLVINYQYNIPNEPKIFVGRKQIFKEIIWTLINNKSILLYGGAGIGKTILAIKAANLIKEEFKDGVFWFRFDIKNINEILNSLGKNFDYELNNIKTIEEKLKTLCSLLVNKKVLIIFDNVDNYNKTFIFSSLAECAKILITTKILPQAKIKNINMVRVNKFTEEETIGLAKKILGWPYVAQNQEKIKKLSSIVGFLPLGLTIVFRQLEKKPNQIDDFLNKLDLKKDVLLTTTDGYDNKTLEKSIELSFNELDQGLKDIFISLGIFKGVDFDKAAVAYINNQNKKETYQQLQTLLKFSLLEKSTKYRFRLHPLVKSFIQSKSVDNKKFKKLADFYLKTLAEYGRGNSTVGYPKIEEDLENIIGIFEKCYQLKFYQSLIDLWEYFGLFLWDTGRWFDVEKYGQLVIKSAHKIGNKKALASCLIRELSWLYFWQGDMDKSNKCIKEGLRIATLLKDEFLIALAKQKKGMVLMSKQKNDQAKTLFIEVIKTFKKLKLADRVADTYLYLGHVCKNLNDLDKAKHYYQKSNYKSLILKEYEAGAISLYYLGEIYLLKKDYFMAKKCFNRALVIDKLRKRKAGIGWCSMGLAKIEKAQGRTKKAIKLFQDAKEVFKQISLMPQYRIVTEELKNLE